MKKIIFLSMVIIGYILFILFPIIFQWSLVKEIFLLNSLYISKVWYWYLIGFILIIIGYYYSR